MRVVVMLMGGSFWDGRSRLRIDVSDSKVG